MTGHRARPAGVTRPVRPRARLGPADRSPGASSARDRRGRLAWARLRAPRPQTDVLLMPTGRSSRRGFWKAQVPYLARHFRVVTFDGRGSGASDRPAGARRTPTRSTPPTPSPCWTPTGVDAAVLVSLSCGATWSVHVAAGHPERVLGLSRSRPSCGFRPAAPGAGRARLGRPRTDARRGWAKYNRHYWLEGGYEDFLAFFFGQMFSEPHSTKQIEDGVGWGLDLAPRRSCDTTRGRLGCDGRWCRVEHRAAACRQVRPVIVVHGTDDASGPAGAIGERLAELTRGEPGPARGRRPRADGPAPRAGQPRRSGDFVESLGPPRPRGSHASRTRPPAHRALLPVVADRARPRPARPRDRRELRDLLPDVRVDWLAQHPVTRVLEAAGERVHPASARLASESAHIEHECRRARPARLPGDPPDGRDPGQQLHGLRRGGRGGALRPRRSATRPGTSTTSCTRTPSSSGSPYRLDDRLRRLAADARRRRARGAADRRLQRRDDRAASRATARLRDRSIFVGNPDDVVADTFGPGLPGIRDWTEDNFDFAGYVTGFDPPALRRPRRAARAELGYGDGRAALRRHRRRLRGRGRRCCAACSTPYPLARAASPDLRFLVVGRARGSTRRRCPASRASRCTATCPTCTAHLAACDVAVVQGGLTTCMELTAAGGPFLYVPLRNHFEQNFHVRHRLDRYGAGTYLAYEDLTEAHRHAAGRRARQAGRLRVGGDRWRRPRRARLADLL